MAREIIRIPASKRMAGKQVTEKKKIRVAAYCRVSSEQDQQLNSFENQVAYYTEYIEKNPDYTMAGIYADEGISGTNTRKRSEFNRMIEDCKAGFIDMIITKSISRFARNTQDCLHYSRMLKDMGIGILFEKEHVDTTAASGELLFTILASLAQDESRAISENVVWGKQSLFSQGKWSMCTSRFYGYDKDEEGNLIKNPEQAKVVKWMYSAFITGMNPDIIARTLNEKGIPGALGKPAWKVSTVKQTLRNEKHMGDVYLQKWYTPDFLSHKIAKNEGQLPMYHIKNDHEAIIDKEIWEAVQIELDRREAFMKEHKLTTLGQFTDKRPFSHKVICGCCGHTYSRRTLTRSWGKVITWECGQRYREKGKRHCVESDVLYERELFDGFVAAWNKILSRRKTNMRKWERMLNSENALERVRAKQFIAITDGMEPLTKMDISLVSKVFEHCIYHSSGDTEYHFLDGTVIIIRTKSVRNKAYFLKSIFPE
ncbi:hypothetical protein BHK98_02460 [Hornefia porci]|uniref:Recombinase family protein n=1 Tax=Hornefia porci TaxID=2652292 RepID=A0A1Q9JFQ3_9FIRM|nr:recombinase family protein [Hornefia porci]OLR55025.1 hypothetical protein BHK98_02460 [Hornefia porci]